MIVAGVLRDKTVLNLTYSRQCAQQYTWGSNTNGHITKFYEQLQGSVAK